MARPATADLERELASAMASARAAEYEVLRERAVAAAGLSGSERARAIKSLRGELRRVRRRDYFPPRERDAAAATVEALARDDTSTTVGTPRTDAANHGGDPA